MILISETLEECVFQLSGGKRFKVSPDDRMLIVAYSWSMDDQGYVRCSTLANQLLSRLIAERMKLDMSLEIDHKDKTPPNNRRDNLRVATHAQNQTNGKVRKHNKSGLKGVNICRDKFHASMSVDGKKVYLGSYDTPEQAHGAYVKASRNQHGEFASP